MTVLQGEKRGEGTGTGIFDIVDTTPYVGVWRAYGYISIYNSNISSDKEDGLS